TVKAAPAVTVSSGEVTAGDEVTVTGAHFTPDATVRIELDGTALGTATVDDLGAFTYTATIPVSTTAGARTIAAVDTTSNRTVNTPLTVKAAPVVLPESEDKSGDDGADEDATGHGDGDGSAADAPGAGEYSLAATGINAGPWLLAGGVLLAAAGVLIGARRIRGSAQ
ncbi:hypothetical protein NCCP1664_14270, partial [Zafaria cholistanensis]